MILDSQSALERIEHDRELYDEICMIFRNDAPHILIQLKDTFAATDIPAATRYAHSLRSAAANIGATDLSDTARKAEDALRAGELEQVSGLGSELDQELAHVMEALRQLSVIQ